MKATDLLQKQHRDIEALLERLSAAGQADEQRIRQELAAILVAHTVIEQEIFYPAVREALPEEILEALEEHGLADVELARLLAVGTGDDAADARTSVLTALVTRHIRREESEIFKAADRELGDDHLASMGEQMGMRFRQILDAGYESLLRLALEEEVPRTPGRKRAAKKPSTRRAVAGTAGSAAKGAAKDAKKTKTPRRAAPKKASPPSRRKINKTTTKRPATKRPSRKNAASKRPATKHAAAKRPISKRPASKRPAAKRASTKRGERATNKMEMHKTPPTALPTRASRTPRGAPRGITTASRPRG